MRGQSGKGKVQTVQCEQGWNDPVLNICASDKSQNWIPAMAINRRDDTGIRQL